MKNWLKMKSAKKLAKTLLIQQQKVTLAKMYASSIYKEELEVLNEEEILSNSEYNVVTVVNKERQAAVIVCFNSKGTKILWCNKHPYVTAPEPFRIISMPTTEKTIEKANEAKTKVEPEVVEKATKTEPEKVNVFRKVIKAKETEIQGRIEEALYLDENSIRIEFQELIPDGNYSKENLELGKEELEALGFTNVKIENDNYICEIA